MSDVFSEYGYKVFEEKEKEKAATKLRTGAIELSSEEEEEEQPPQPEIVVLHLQGPLGKYRFRLPNVLFFHPFPLFRANLRPRRFEK